MYILKIFLKQYVDEDVVDTIFKGNNSAVSSSAYYLDYTTEFIHS